MVEYARAEGKNETLARLGARVERSKIASLARSGGEKERERNDVQRCGLENEIHARNWREAARARPNENNRDVREILRAVP